MHLFLLIWFRRIQKKIAIHFKVLPQDHFGPTLTVASNILQPEAQFGPRNTSAPIILLPDAYFSLRYFSPEVLLPETTSPNTLWPQDQIFKSVIFNQLGPSMGLGGYLPGLAKNWKICLAKTKNQNYLHCGGCYLVQ